jgi:hypothetical protein
MLEMDSRSEENGDLSSGSEKRDQMPESLEDPGGEMGAT